MPTKEKRLRAEDRDMVLTSMYLPRELWRGAKIRAAEEDRTYQAVIASALGEYLAKPARREARR